MDVVLFISEHCFISCRKAEVECLFHINLFHYRSLQINPSSLSYEIKCNEYTKYPLNTHAELLIKKVSIHEMADSCTESPRYAGNDVHIRTYDTQIRLFVSRKSRNNVPPELPELRSLRDVPEFAGSPQRRAL